MAIERFWFNIRAGANFRLSQAVVDSPRLDAERIEIILRNDTQWLSLNSVEGYDPNDFGFLSEQERRQLTENIEHFRATAARVLKDAPPTDDQVREAMPEFKNILTILRPDRYGDFDALIPGKKIEGEVRGKLPGWARELIFETGFDVSEQPAIWIWVEVDDRSTDENEISRCFDLVRADLRSAARRICPERWPFVSLRGISEREPTEKNKPQKKRQKTKK